MGKYLFFDIDGTLMSEKTHKVPQSTIHAIKKAKENGHHCFLCTGRSYNMAQEVSIVGINDAIIANGAAVVFQGKVELQKVIPSEIVEHTLSLVDALHGGYQLIDWENGYQNPYTHKMFEKNFKEKFNRPVEELFQSKAMLTIDQLKNNPILKIDVNFDAVEDTQKFLNELDPHLNFITAGGYTSSFGAKAGEIMLKGVSKGAAIKNFMDSIHESMDNAYAFGDSTNDIEMLETVGTGIAMGNGASQAKAAADYVTTAVDEDGIALAMKYFELI